MRMRQTAANAPNTGPGGRAPGPPRFLAGAEPAAARDEQLGLIFRNMRLAMKVPRETIARRLATSPATIDNFEAGAIGALPHWKESARIIRGYCELLRLDPEPILWRVRDLLKAPPTEVRALAPAPAPARPRTVGHPSQAPGPAAQAERTRTRPSGRRRTVRALFALSAPVAIAASVAILAQVAPGPAYRVVRLLPGLIEAPARAGLDYAVRLMAPRREGLQWIEVGDPRLRKADKLQTSTR
jgi:helix-turn-helix protein